MDHLQGAWSELQASAAHTLFQSFAWNRLAASVFAACEQPYAVYVESDSGAAIIPAAIADHGITLLGEALFDYRNVLHTGDLAILKRAWQEIAALRRPLFFTALREEQASRCWREFHPQSFVSAPCVRLDDTDAEQFASRHRRLGSRLRRLLRNGIEFRKQSSPPAELIRHIYELKAAQMPGSLFGDPARVNFMTAACACTGCDLYTLIRDGELIAALVTFRDGHTRRFYTSYYSHQWAHFSPGIVLLYEATRCSLAEGLNCDYMTGEQSHKMRLATGKVPLFRVETSWDKIASISGFEEQEVVSELAA